MKCKDVQQHLLDYSESQLDRKTHAQIEEHLRHCDACAQELKDFEQTVELLQSTSLQAPPEKFWEDFSTGVMRKVRRMDTPSRPLSSFLFPSLKPATVALATLVLVLGAALLYIYASGVLERYLPAPFKGHPAMQAEVERQHQDELEMFLGKFVPDEMVDEILESDFALIDSEEFTAPSFDTDETTLYLLIESLDDEEKTLLLSELEELRERLRRP